VAYLLDTQLLLWLEAHPAKIPKAVINDLANPQVPIFYSVISLFEIGIMRSIKKLPFEPADVASSATASQILQLPLETAHCAALARIPVLHRDPFDRLLVSQAQVEGLTLLTTDSNLAQYGPHVRVV
jgi:PIN domain nuclease of toxin-antitoxin system